ncbi:PA2778 family cysteine peptidase [Crenobacter sp. SG2303]|uniref:PA2778 family cysteine peptidase n=1 Tax=Crenobacter oryzisoli TaxID=3056844 RepID=A0ABT7XPB1_9NEIS|nr:PA2778 family cysteine peptidase [Crenobacter sp. SG2303]MDN0075399.1 PA2778 family cysteine peptidase [Crenobacter sp. SG2303]
MRTALGVLLIGLLLLLVGCATPPQTAALLALRPAGLPERVELTNVPFFPQVAYQCGPAALATVLVHAGVLTTPEQLTPQVYLPERKGSLQAELLGATRRYGMVAYQVMPTLEAVLREVEAGDPVLVLQNLRLKSLPQWHYAVVVGYDLASARLVLRSGDMERLELPLAQFERSWADGERWAVVVLPPERPPATATEAAYLAAVTALERISPTAAQRAYQTALTRWPNSLVAYIGLGNSAYAQKDLNGAERAYRQAIAAHPDAGDAWNNLGQVLADQGRRADALAAVRRAIELGGPHLEQYRRTLSQITSHAAPRLQSPFGPGVP